MNNLALVHYSKLKFVHKVDIIMWLMDHICNLVHHENKLNQSGFCQKWSKSPNLSPYRKLFVNNFALVNYSKLKYVHKIDIIMLLLDHICNLIHHENKLN